MSTKRYPISRRNRFRIFRRDRFVCQYCGARPPDVTLEIDHITPVSDEGGNSLQNLITACFDCNRGKATESAAPKSADRESAAKRIATIFLQSFEDFELGPDGKAMLRYALAFLPEAVVAAAMLEATSRFDAPNFCFGYFYGTCWWRINNERYRWRVHGA